MIKIEMEIGTNISNLIKQSNFTREELAAAIGLNSPNPVNRWCNGTSKPKLVHLYKLTNILKVSSKDILGF